MGLICKVSFLKYFVNLFRIRCKLLIKNDFCDFLHFTIQLTFILKLKGNMFVFVHEKVGKHQNNLNLYYKVRTYLGF